MIAIAAAASNLERQIQAARQSYLSAISETAAQQGKLDEVQQRLASTGASIEVFELNLEMQSALHVLGDIAEPADPELVARLNVEKSDFAALTAAIAIQRDRIATAEAVEAAAKADFHDAVIPLFHAERATAVAEITALIDRTRDALVKLIRTDILQDSVVGSSFSYCGDLPLFSGSHVAKAFINSMKDRLRPASFDEKSFFVEARARADQQFAQIQKEN